jgi:MFS family permease
VQGTACVVLFAISFFHLLNDTMQALLPALYPVLKSAFDLDFRQIGLITLTFQLTASLLQPAVGLYTDHRPQPYSLVAGMGLSLAGLLVLSIAPSYPLLLLSAALVGMGSAVFHPESSRVARMASGGRHGFASRSSRSAATPARRSGRSSPRSWWCPAGSGAWPGSAPQRSRGWSSWPWSAPGTARTVAPPPRCGA